MTNRTAVTTTAAPAAIGTYSQAIQVGQTVYCSGQIPLDPSTMMVVDGDFQAQAQQVFQNLRAVCQAAGGDLAQIVKLTIYLIDLANFPVVNAVMTEYFKEPYPARATVQVVALPKNVAIEVDAVLVL